MQEVITLVVFTESSVIYLSEDPRWNHVVAFALLVGAVAFASWPARSPAVFPLDGGR